MDSTPHSLISLLLAEDHHLVRRGIVSILSLEPGIRIAGEAADGEEALDLALKLSPDVILMDVEMPGMDGLQATAEVKRYRPETGILILSAHPDESLILKAVDAGASGYLLKNITREELIAAIRSVAAGQRYFSSTLPRLLVERAIERAGSRGAGGEGRGSYRAPGGAGQY